MVRPGPKVPARSVDPTMRALGAALTTVVLWASAFVGIRAAGHDLAAGPLTLARLAVGTLALGALVLARREPLPPRHAWPRLLAVGVLWFGVYNLALNQAERSVDAGTAAMLVNIGPVFIAILAGTVLHEGFPRKLVAGCAVAFAGAIVIGAATSSGGASAWGAALCVLAAAAYAVAVVAQKPLLGGTTSALMVTWIACTVGLVCCLPFAPRLVAEAGDADAGNLVWAVYLGLFPTAIAFTTWAYALARTSAGKMGATTYLVPPLAILLGWAVQGETPPALAIAGGVLCLAGAGLARSRDKPRVFRRNSVPTLLPWPIRRRRSSASPPSPTPPPAGTPRAWSWTRRR
jgi:drug/metabolite transporter (DMT)-like permease